MVMEAPLTSLIKAGVVLLLPLLTIADPDPDRGAKRGFREKIRCIDNGKFYRNPNTPRDLAFRKVQCACVPMPLLFKPSYVSIYRVDGFKNSQWHAFYLIDK